MRGVARLVSPITKDAASPAEEDIPAGEGATD